MGLTDIVTEHMPDFMAIRFGRLDDTENKLYSLLKEGRKLVGGNIMAAQTDMDRLRETTDNMRGILVHYHGRYEEYFGRGLAALSNDVRFLLGYKTV